MGVLPLCRPYMSIKGLISINWFFRKCWKKWIWSQKSQAFNTGSRRIFMTVNYFVLTSFWPLSHYWLHSTFSLKNYFSQLGHSHKKLQTLIELKFLYFPSSPFGIIVFQAGREFGDCIVIGKSFTYEVTNKGSENQVCYPRKCWVILSF